MPRKPTRRTFLKLSAATASLTASDLAHAAPQIERIAVVSDGHSSLVNNDAVKWATKKLCDAITPARLDTRDDNGPVDHFDSPTIVIAPVTSNFATFPSLPTFTQPETTALIPGHFNSHRAILATGSDSRGITYALLELADRIRLGDPSSFADSTSPPPSSRPPPTRSAACARAFVSEIEDKPWFYDRAFWTRYLDTLAAARFNRFNFALGLGYDFPRGVTGDYLHFPYPYLVEVPGYPQVHVEPAARSPASASATSKPSNSSPPKPPAAASTSSSASGPTPTSGPTAPTPTTTSPASRPRPTPPTAATPSRSPQAMPADHRPHHAHPRRKRHPRRQLPLLADALRRHLRRAAGPIEIDMHAKGLNQI